MKKLLLKLKKNEGLILVNVIVFSSIAIIIIVGISSWFGSVIKANRDAVDREQAFQIAEAGIEYYRWHLAHAQSDYMDGTGTTTQPYIHEYFDKNGDKIGRFELYITPPEIGSTLVTLISSGFIESKPNIKRTIKSQLAIPSLAKYAFVADSDMRFGEGTEVFGPIHSNGGIRFDGLAHNVISSARASYDDPDHSGPNEFGVHTHLPPTDPYPPSAVPDRLDVFQSGREFPAPAVDFAGLITDLALLKTQAQEDGKYFASSGQLGYKLVLKTNDTFDLYRVTSLESPGSGCYDVQDQDGWGSWTVKNTSFIGNYNNPDNGVIFLEDNVWVEGQINTARLTIAVARFPDSPTNRRSITINKDLTYTNYDGRDVIALVAQKNINAGMISEDDLKIDGALVAQNGRVGRYYYASPIWFFNRCSPYHNRQKITLTGMIASKERYGFAYTDETGYQIRNITYDANLLYSPPPDFPLTSEYYENISWEEIE